MGTGWRRAFCTTIPREIDSTIADNQQRSPSPSASPSPRSCTRLRFFSNPSTPRLQQKQKQQSQPVSSPSLRCRSVTEAAPKATNEGPRRTKSSKTLLSSNPSSPRSPLKLSLFKNSFKFRSSCGICLNSVKTGQGTAIYTAECAHAFHFPCIAAHVRKHGSLVCPVCNATWKNVPLLAVHNNLSSESAEKQHDAIDTNIKKPNAQEKIIPVDNSPRSFKIKHVEQPNLKHSDSIRSYDDDEALLSPTQGGRIVPIPEADENLEEEQDEDDDDAEEFQGFFVNPTPSSSIQSSFDELQISGRDSRNVDVRLMPECAVVSVTRTHDTYALALRVKAPPPILGPSQRAPIDLVTVLDVSGSMTGAKLHMLKGGMRLVISSLGPADRLSIVAFSACTKRLLPLRRMTAQGQRAAGLLIDQLVCGQGNSVGEALRKATKVLKDRRERNPVACIMLLSDGQDERMPSCNTNQRQCSSHVSSTRFAHIEIPVHAFGFGRKGGYNHEPAEDAFAKCVGGLLSIVVQDLRIQLGFPSSSTTAEICAVYSCSGRPTVLSSSSVRLGDLYAEEEKELLLELRVPTSALGTHHVMTIRCVYRDPPTQEIVHGREQSLLVPPPRSVGSSRQLRNLFITTRAIAESRRLVEHNDFTSAHHLLSSAQALLMQSSSISADEYVRGLEAELGELHCRRQHQIEKNQMMMIQRRRGNDREMAMVDENGEPLTPTSAWRAAEKLAKVAMMKKSLNGVSDLHGFENARF
ncbi:Zinc finger (C3HC4-type RING finger) family protein [Quillaja saponaria]|uniref:Zinc finger (C3HC4-type RING finger) family protein n=1 Tax=Quillaja saponaria TaxID=32244 RepID=A0AAD7PKX3_QUISA|nr:Zinc finger (C3HC4-type RING finger) family protein [Quillaja saponaria]